MQLSMTLQLVTTEQNMIAFQCEQSCFHVSPHFSSIQLLLLAPPAPERRQRHLPQHGDGGVGGAAGLQLERRGGVYLGDLGQRSHQLRRRVHQVSAVSYLDTEGSSEDTHHPPEHINTDGTDGIVKTSTKNQC